MTQQQERRFWISEKQLVALRKGWTHTDICDPKNILTTVWEDQMIESRPAPQQPFTEEEREYLEELILDNREQYPDSGTFTPEKRDALYQKIAYPHQPPAPAAPDVLDELEDLKAWACKNRNRMSDWNDGCPFVWWYELRDEIDRRKAALRAREVQQG